MTHQQTDEEICCPVFNPEPWDHKTWEWKDKLFLKDSMRTFFHIPSPVAISKVVGRMWKTTQEAGAAPDAADVILMANDPSAFRSDYYLNLTKEIPGANMVRLSGTFYTQVFDGPYNAVPKWISAMKSEAQARGSRLTDFYFYYTTCPKCAKKYGHNYVVAFARVG
jgi:hypothetical protein